MGDESSNVPAHILYQRLIEAYKKEAKTLIEYGEFESAISVCSLLGMTERIAEELRGEVDQGFWNTPTMEAAGE